jgi:hypothetical protein
MLVTAQGGASFTSEEFTLDVGCSQASFTDEPGFVTSLDLHKDDPFVGVYSFSHPTIDPTYCSITSTALV